jgi:hypothetical protein
MAVRQLINGVAMQELQHNWGTSNLGKYVDQCCQVESQYSNFLVSMLGILLEMLTLNH